ncbi:MAG: FHA domain-containing protein, partial [Planctomycetes bacterium]|nr:FHA domain-containing protein [Planctomycetota bacterium]
MGARLIIENDMGSSMVYELDPERMITLGRNQNNSIVLADEHASRWHAEIYFQDDHWQIRDLDTRNGTYLDRQRLDGPTPLAEGQEIRIGSTR